MYSNTQQGEQVYSLLLAMVRALSTGNQLMMYACLTSLLVMLP